MSKQNDTISVLVVDDEQVLTTLVSKHLESDGGFEVIVENQSTNALDTAIRTKPDVILLDIVMPEIDGNVIHSQLEETDETKDIPVILLSALIPSSACIKEHTEKNGGYFLAKPFSHEQLLAIINKALDAAE